LWWLSAAPPLVWMFLSKLQVNALFLPVRGDVGPALLVGEADARESVAAGSSAAEQVASAPGTRVWTRDVKGASAEPGDDPEGTSHN